ncbi:MAG: 2-hydroxyglutaryl-CoA dehydratase, D-component, partial [Clostridiales bacterium]|nr:2-hydroxyglutaryl-CoA dehydratase, D-component [Clostridiales bacterium]
ISTFIEAFGVTEREVENTRIRLNEVRKLARRIDELTYIDNKASGFENHLYQVSLSDFNGSISECESMLKEKIKEIDLRKPRTAEMRIGYIGVPPMTCDLYEYVESFGARVVYNEVQREFAFPRAEALQNIYEQYIDYTYPYDIRFRLDEIKKQIKLRRLDAVIHYTQAFCYRGIEDIIVKQELDVPVLTIEGDKLNTLDSRTKLRLEAFLDMLSDQKGVNT